MARYVGNSAVVLCLTALLLAGGCESPPGPVAPGFSALRSVVMVEDTTLASGSSMIVTLRVRDASGSNVAFSGHKVAFTFDGGASSGAFSPVVDHRDGTYTALLRGTVSGTPSQITATYDSLT